MTSPTTIPVLSELEFIPYLQDGQIPTDFDRKVGVYAIFDEAKTLRYIGYSRNVYLSLKQHLVRQPDACYWIKVCCIERPSRTALEEIQSAWIEENGELPDGNGAISHLWNQPIDAKQTLTATDKAQFEQLDDLGKIKFLKQTARRVEAKVLEKLQARGVKMDLRFNPKLKEDGLLDLK
ncbi:MAG: GIY-YIG nuclease family protein [Thainema sp.]